MKRITLVSQICALFFGLNVFAQVGIGTTSPTTTLDSNGALSLREGTALVLSNGNNNNVSLGVTPFSLYRITGPTATFNITGVIPVAASDGQIVTLQNTTTQIMTVLHNSNLSAAPNRIYVPAEKDLQIRGRYATVTLQYNTTQNRWIVLNKYNHLETWYLNGVTLFNGLNTFNPPLPGLTNASSLSVSLVGPVPPGIAINLVIEYVEAQNGILVFRVVNYGATVTGATFAITVNKI